MVLDVDFPTLHGKVGNWPGDINPQCAEVIYNTALSFKDKGNAAIFVDMGTGPGRSTIFLASAAQQIGAKVYAIDDWLEPASRLWFDRAMRLFRMMQVVTPVQGEHRLPPADFVLMHAIDETVVKEIWDNAVCPGGALMFIGNVKPDLIDQPGEHGIGFHMWRRSADVTMPTAPQVPDDVVHTGVATVNEYVNGVDVTPVEVDAQAVVESSEPAGEVLPE